MIPTHISFIRTLRKERGLSQAYMADKLALSRPSYIAVEQGKRELSLAEAEKLADVLGTTLEEIKSGMVPRYDKYQEMILAYIRKASGKDGKIPKTKLAKLLYLADFSWFYKHLESMSGMQYRKIQYGPVPDLYFRALDELEESGKIVIDRKSTEGKEMLLISESDGNKKETLSTLSVSEEKLIEHISEKWKSKKTSEIVNFTHNQLPYFLCRENELIPYALITQEDPDKVY